MISNALRKTRTQLGPSSSLDLRESAYGPLLRPPRGRCSPALKPKRQLVVTQFSSASPSRVSEEVPPLIESDGEDEVAANDPETQDTSHRAGPRVAKAIAVAAAVVPPPPCRSPPLVLPQGGGGLSLGEPERAKPPPKRAVRSILVESGEHVQEFKVKWSTTTKFHTERVKE